MLDLAFNVLNTWGPLGNLKQVPLGGSSAQQWANSSYSIIYGSSTNWILGFGRSTNILGPDTKWVMDWNELWNLIPIGSSKSAGNYFKAIGVGAVGSTDLIIGPKNALNYGVQDISVTSKKKKSISITYSDVVESKEKIGKIRIAILVIGSLVTIGANVLARIVFMSEALSSSATTRQLTQNGLQVGSNFLTPRMISLLTVLEVAFDCVKKLTDAKKIEEKAIDAKNTAEKAQTGAGNALISELSDQQSKNLIAPLLLNAGDKLQEVVDEVKREASIVVQEMSAAIPDANPIQNQLDVLEAKVTEIERSSLSKALNHASYALSADTGPVSFDVSNKASINLSADANGGKASIAATNSAELKGTNRVHVLSDQHITLRLGDDQNSQNNLTLDGADITLRCGAPNAGPAFTMNGNGEKLVLARGDNLLSSDKLEIINKKVGLSSKHQLQTGKVVVEPAKFTLSADNIGAGSTVVGDSSSLSLSVGVMAKIVANQNSIKLEVGQSSITIDLSGVVIKGTNVKTQAEMMAELETMIDKKVSEAMSQSQAPLEKKDAGGS